MAPEKPDEKPKEAPEKPADDDETIQTFRRHHREVLDEALDAKLTQFFGPTIPDDEKEKPEHGEKEPGDDDRGGARAERAATGRRTPFLSRLLYGQR